MLISRNNFKEKLQFIKETIKKCDYVAIDLEFTGSVSHKQYNRQPYDNINQQYWKNKQNVEKFFPIQVGICGFQQIDDDNVTAFPFNFNVLPLANDNLDHNRQYMNASTLQFLGKNNFDFNKLFYEGIEYISLEQKQIMQNLDIADELFKINRLKNQPITPEQIYFYQLNIEQINKFLQEKQTNTLQIPIKFVNPKAQEYLIDQINQQVSKQSNDYELMFEIDNDDNCLTITKNNLQLDKESLDIKQKNNDKEVNIGFEELIYFLKENKIPLIFYNGLYDVMHMQEKFYNGLPQLFDDFNKEIEQNFPIFYDVKSFVQQDVFQKSKINKKQFLELQDFYLIYKHDQPQIQVDIGFDQLHLQDSQQHYHNAGFDAYVTGSLFIKLKKFMKKNKNNQVLESYQNKLYQQKQQQTDISEQDSKMKYIYHLQNHNIYQQVDVLKLKEYFIQLNLNVVIEQLEDKNQYLVLFQGEQSLNCFIEQKNSNIIQIEENKLLFQKYQDYLDKIKKFFKFKIDQRDE